MRWQRRITAAATASALGIVTGCAEMPESEGRTTATTAVEAACNTPHPSLMAPERYTGLENPVPATPDNLRAGRRLYEQDATPVACARCHGAEGEGDGRLAGYVDPPPTDLTCLDRASGVSDGQLFWVIENGSAYNTAAQGPVKRPGRRARPTAMRAHRFTLSRTEIWQLVLYVRSLAGATSTSAQR